MKNGKMPFMGGTIAAIVIIIVLVIVSKCFGGDIERTVTNVEPTERPTMGFLPNTEIMNLPTE